MMGNPSVDCLGVSISQIAKKIIQYSKIRCGNDALLDPQAI